MSTNKNDKRNRGTDITADELLRRLKNEAGYAAIQQKKKAADPQNAAEYPYPEESRGVQNEDVFAADIPTEDSDLDIDALLRKYLPEEYENGTAPAEDAELPKKRRSMFSSGKTRAIPDLSYTADIALAGQAQSGGAAQENWQDETYDANPDDDAYLIAPDAQFFEEAEQESDPYSTGEGEYYAEDGQYYDENGEYAEDGQYYDENGEYVEDGQYYNENGEYVEDGQYYDENGEYVEDGQYYDENGEYVEDGQYYDENGEYAEDGQYYDENGEYVGDGQYYDENGEYVEDGQYYDENGEYVEDGQYYDENGEYVEDGQYYDENGEYVEDGQYYDENGEYAEDGESVESPIAAAETEEAEEIDKSDINLMMALGLEKELEETLGSDAEKVQADLQAEQTAQLNKTPRYVNYEYSDRSQTKKVVDAYKYAYKSTTVKLIGAALFALVLFFYENLRLFGVQFSGTLDPLVYPVVYIMVDLQITLLCCAFAYEQILFGIGSIFKGKISPESVASCMLLLGIAHSILASVFYTHGVEVTMYNFPVAIAAIMALVYSYFNTKREIFSFNIVSSKRPKYVFTKLQSVESEAERNAFADLTEENPEVLRIDKTAFVDGYFTRTNKPSGAKFVLSLIIPLVLAVSVLFFLVSYRLKGDLLLAFNTAYVTALFCLPISVFFTYSVPFYQANKTAYENDSTIIGETSIEEYSDASIVSFEDKNVFPSYGVKVQNINIYNNNRIDRVLYYAASVFAKVGGPLADVFEVATMEMGYSDNVEIVDNEDGCLEAMVDGRQIIFGKPSSIEKLGIEISPSVWDEDQYAEPDVCVMYMIRGGQLMAKMYVKYILDTDFEFILKQLVAGGMCVGIRTFDPNIDEDMIGRVLQLHKYPLRVIKYRALSDIPVARERADSGIVSRGSTKALLQTVSLCDKILHVRKTNLVIKILAIFISLIVMWLLTISGGMTALLSVYIAIYQLFWIIPMFVTSKIFIN